MRSIDRDMNVALALSYRYLTAGQQKLFRWLALHPGDSFSTHAARAIAGGDSPAGTVQALEVLLDFHLLEELTPGRFEFHALIREYAADLTEAVDPEPDRQAATRRLLDYYLALADHADRVVHRSQAGQAAGRICRARPARAGHPERVRGAAARR